MMVIKVLFLEEFARTNCERFHFAGGIRNSTCSLKEGLLQIALNAQTRRELSANSISSISLKWADCHDGSWDWDEIGAKESTVGAKKKGNTDRKGNIG